MLSLIPGTLADLLPPHALKGPTLMPPDAESSTIPMPVAVGPDEPLTPVALTPDALARLLSAAGGKAVTIDMVQAVIDAAR